MMIIAKAKTRYVVLLVSSMVIFAASSAFVFLYFAQQQSRRANVVLGSVAAVSSHKPTTYDIDSYTAAADEPRYITIRSLNVHARVLPMGLTKERAIQAPANIHDAGWYTQSAKPGEPGVMFIDGHVSSWESNGVFYELSKLRSGDVLSIIGGDDKIYDYKVSGQKVYDATQVDMKSLLSSSGETARLIVMTCTGKFDRDTGTFNQRLVVFADLISH